MNVAILLLASGRGLRMGAAMPKVYLPIDGTPILVRSLGRLKQLADAPQIVLAVHPDDRATHLQPLLPDLERLGLTDVVDGGETRQDSMANALAVCAPDRDLVVIHDAARPFFPIAAARQAMHRAADVGAALLAVPIPDTIKRVDAEFRVTETVDRNGLWLAQTPQVAQRSRLEQALAAARAENHQASDDASLLESLGIPVEVVPSTPKNIKVTVAADLELAEMLARMEVST